jgi:predicted PhzF superfamily epimerase YddE/YHI9
VKSRFGDHYVARQGMQLGRDGRVSVRIGKDHVQIGGHAVTCVDGTLTPN